MHLVRFPALIQTNAPTFITLSFTAVFPATSLHYVLFHSFFCGFHRGLRHTNDVRSYRNGTYVFAEPLSLPDNVPEKKTSLTIRAETWASESTDFCFKTTNCPPNRPPYRNQSDLEGRRACVRARPQRRSNKERKWPLLACRRFFLVSYASFIIICFDASFLDVVSCSLCLFKTHSHHSPAHTGRVYTMVWTLSLGFWHAHIPVVKSFRLRTSIRNAYVCKYITWEFFKLTEWIT